MSQADTRITMSCRTIVMGAAIASASTASVPTICPGAGTIQPDPIFAALERCQRMEAACDEAAAAQTDPEDDIDAEASEALAARAALAQVVPTTWPGFAALISFVAERTAFYSDHYFQNADEMVDYSRSLDQAIKRLGPKVRS